MKFLDKWLELENLILSEVTQSQKNTHGMHSLISDTSLEAWNNEDTIPISNKAHTEGRRGPWSWKGSVQQCSRIPGQGSRKGWIGEQGERRGLMELSERGDLGKRKSLEM